MNFTSIGDLSHSYMQRRQTGALKQQMGQLTAELTTGQTQDIVQHLSGNMGQIAHIDNGLRMNASFSNAASEALADMSIMQASLTQLHNRSDELSVSAALAGTARDQSTLTTLAATARSSLSSYSSALNVANGGRVLFAGSDTGGTAIEGAETVMTAARAAVSGASTAADVMAALDVMFDTPGGAFDTGLFQGNSPDLLSFHLGGDETVALDVRADSDAIRELYKNTVAAALVDDPGVTLSLHESQQLAQAAGAGLLENAEGLAGLSAGLGVAEAHVERTAARYEAETTSLQITRNELLGVDQFDVASQLERVQFQLETIFTVTARNARLSLVNFL